MIIDNDDFAEVNESMNKIDPVKILRKETLSSDWYQLYKYTYSIGRKTEKHIEREVYEKGHGSTAFLYNPKTNKVLLTKQFRLPVFINEGNEGNVLECCAGIIDGENAEECIKREIREELGYKIDHVDRLFKVYMSPGSITETVTFFSAKYDYDDRISAGGGELDEQEYIDVVEMNFEEAYALIEQQEMIDAKTVLLFQYAKLNLIGAS